MPEDKEPAAAAEMEAEMEAAAADGTAAASAEEAPEAAGHPEQDELTQEEKRLHELEVSAAQLEEENRTLKDQLLRKQADFDNFRKRMFREKEESIRYANSQLLTSLVAVIDDFERAIGSAESSTDFESFLAGIKLIEKQFVGMLERDWGLKRMATVGKEFDPQEHEALMTEECDDCSIETVLDDYQKGYYLHDRVLRHAKVKVGIPRSDSREPAAPESPAADASEAFSDADQDRNERGEGKVKKGKRTG